MCVWVCVCGKLFCTQNHGVIGQNFLWVERAGLAHCLPEIQKTAFILALPVKPFLAQGLHPCPGESGIGQDKFAS